MKISEYLQANGLPRPVVTVSRVIGGLCEGNPGQKTKISEWINKYMETKNELDNLVWGDGKQLANIEENERLINELDSAAQQVRDEFPELGMIHDLIMTDFFRELDYPRASAYYDRAVGYYQNVFSKRGKEAGVDVWERSLDDFKESYALSEQKYRQMGYEMIADFYAELSEHGYNRHSKDLWRTDRSSL